MSYRYLAFHNKSTISLPNITNSPVEPHGVMQSSWYSENKWLFKAILTGALISMSGFLTSYNTLACASTGALLYDDLKSLVNIGNIAMICLTISALTLKHSIIGL